MENNEILSKLGKNAEKSTIDFLCYLILEKKINYNDIFGYEKEIVFENKELSKLIGKVTIKQEGMSITTLNYFGDYIKRRLKEKERAHNKR